MADDTIISGLSNAPSQIPGIFTNPNLTGETIDPNIKIQEKALSDGTHYNWTYPPDYPKYYLQLTISRLNINWSEVPGKLLSGNKITNLVTEGYMRLPLPLGLVDTHSVDYSEESYLPSLATIQNQILPNAARSSLGIAPNPMLTILLRGPKYKRHQFTWRFSPKTGAESRILNHIIRTLNNSMAPTLRGAGPTTWFDFPRIFTIAIMPNSQYMFKFKPTVLESMVVNYTPGGQASFFRASQSTPVTTTKGNGNAPEGFEISMQFLELEFWLHGDFKDNNDPYDVTRPPVAPGVLVDEHGNL